MKKTATLLLAITMALCSGADAWDDDVKERIHEAPSDAVLSVTLESGKFLRGTVVEREDGQFLLLYALEQSSDGENARRSRWIPYGDVAELHVHGVDEVPGASDLPYRLRIGDHARVYVAGDVWNGKVSDFDEESIRIDERTLILEDVAKIELRESDSLRNGALIGFGVASALVGLACTQACDVDFAILALIVQGGLGAGLGALIDSMNTRYTTIYVGDDRKRTLTFAPLITPDRKGVLVSFSF